jgi:SAM-dependent methyltransferase
MSDETSKTNHLRDQAFFDVYLSSSVIDIGCGEDLVVPHARPFDVAHGDANCITKFVSETFACVHSSHCLEHMNDPAAVLREWWQLVAPGGHLIVVIPDEALYEQGYWPSLFNPDHKWAFSLSLARCGKAHVLNPVSLVARLPGARISNVEIQDSGYDYRIRRNGEAMGPALRRSFARRQQWIEEIRPVWLKKVFRLLNRIPSRIEFLRGYPVDQTCETTLGQIRVCEIALAQIQIIARKDE